MKTVNMISALILLKSKTLFRIRGKSKFVTKSFILTDKFLVSNYNNSKTKF